MSKQRETSNLSEQQKQFVKLLESIDYGSSSYDVFRDFCEVSAMSFVGTFTKSQQAKERLNRLGEKYNKEQFVLFGKALDILTDALEVEYQDFLGEVYMALNISNARSGQFFTPYCLCRMMAKMSLPQNLEQEIAERGGFISVNDCACGSAALLIAVVDEFRGQKIDWSNKLYIVAQDIDITCCYMAYVQLSLSGVAATVIHGNSLLPDEGYEQWNTPVYYLNFWSVKLALREMKKAEYQPEQFEANLKSSMKFVKESSGQLAFDFSVNDKEVA